MITIVISDGIDVDLLGLKQVLSRLKPIIHQARPSEDLFALVREANPTLAIVETDETPDAFQALAAQVAQNPTLRNLALVAGLTTPATVSLLQALAATSCAEVWSLAVHPDDFGHRVADLAGLPQRLARRIAVQLELVIESKTGKASGKLINISATGAGAEIDAPLDKGVVVARVVGGFLKLDLKCRIVWCHPGPSGSHYFAGLEFLDHGANTQNLLKQAALYTVEPMIGPRPPGTKRCTTVHLHGLIDDSIDLKPLAKQLAGADFVDVDMRAVRIVSAAGISAWHNLLRGLDGIPVRLRHCAQTFIRQLQPHAEWLQLATISSWFVRFRCPGCHRVGEKLVDRRTTSAQDDGVVLPTFRCIPCGQAMVAMAE